MMHHHHPLQGEEEEYDDQQASTSHHSVSTFSEEPTLRANWKEVGFAEEPLAQEEVNSQQQPGWFAGLRNKIAEFSMSDWLNQLGLAKPASPLTGRRASEPLSPPPEVISSTVVGRSRSEGPNGQDPRLSIHDEDELWDQLPNFWLNLDPGRSYNDTLELQHFGPLANLLTLGKPVPGKGHDFQPISMANPTWCDKCGDFIWGFLRQALRCNNCNYTCHYKCRILVTLDCQSKSNSDSLKSNSTQSTYLTATSDAMSQLLEINHQLQLQQQTNTDKEGDTTPTEDCSPLVCPFDWPEGLQGEKLVNAIENYNSTSAVEGCAIELDGNGVDFSGGLQVHMNFMRPINVVAGERPPSVYDVVGGNTAGTRGVRTITSFFLPRNTVKTIHVASTTTTRQMIVSLLRKFRVADNPHKFALYERSFDVDGDLTVKAKLHRIADDVCPLRLALTRCKDSKKDLVLQENDTGDILWDAFEVPELENFLRILEMEEQQYAWRIRQRYQLYKHYLELELKQRGEIVSMATASSNDTVLQGADDFTQISDATIFPSAPSADGGGGGSVKFRDSRHATLDSRINTSSEEYSSDAGVIDSSRRHGRGTL